MRRLLALALLALPALGQLPLPGGSNGAGGAGTGQAPQITSLGTITAGSALSATSNTYSSWTATFNGAGPYTFTMSGQTAGQLIQFSLTEDATGFRTVTLPTGYNTSIPWTSMGPNVTVNLLYRWNGSTADLLSAVVTSGPSFGAAQTEPSYNPASGNYESWFDSTMLAPVWKNASGVHSTGQNQFFPMGGCLSNSFQPASGISFTSLSTDNCLGDEQAVAVFNASTTQSYLVVHTFPPAFWNAATGTVSVTVQWWQNGGASDGNIQWNAALVCLAPGGTPASSPTYNTASTSTVAQPGSTVAGQTTMSALNLTGCSNASLYFIKVYNSLNGSGGTTSARLPNVTGVVVSFQ